LSSEESALFRQWECLVQRISKKVGMVNGIFSPYLGFYGSLEMSFYLAMSNLLIILFFFKL
jgi:hypothetical protein